MKFKYLLVLLILGFLLTTIGTLFKIMHWQYASIAYTTGVFLKVLFCILLIYKLLTTEKFKDFLNW